MCFQLVGGPISLGSLVGRRLFMYEMCVVQWKLITPRINHYPAKKNNEEKPQKQFKIIASYPRPLLSR